MSESIFFTFCFLKILKCRLLIAWERCTYFIFRETTLAYITNIRTCSIPYPSLFLQLSKENLTSWKGTIMATTRLCGMAATSSPFIYEVAQVKHGVISHIYLAMDILDVWKQFSIRRQVRKCST